MPNVLSVAPTPSLASVLPGHNFADAFMIRVGEPGLTARMAAERAFQSPPSWYKVLMALRNRLAGLAGLKSSAEHFAPTTLMLGGFPVVSETPERIVLGFDDIHLNFRIVIETKPELSRATAVAVSTLVQTHNIMGRAYLISILPFHKLIARTLTANTARP